MWEKTPVRVTLQELGFDQETCAQFRRLGLNEVGRGFHELVADLRVKQQRYVNIL